jgi:hypothetical protein
MVLHLAFYLFLLTWLLPHSWYCYYHRSQRFFHCHCYSKGVFFCIPCHIHYHWKYRRYIWQIIRIQIRNDFFVSETILCPAMLSSLRHDRQQLNDWSAQFWRRTKSLFLDCDRGQAPEAMEQNMLVAFYTSVASLLATMECKMWANLTWILWANLTWTKDEPAYQPLTTLWNWRQAGSSSVPKVLMLQAWSHFTLCWWF